MYETTTRDIVLALIIGTFVVGGLLGLVWLMAVNAQQTRIVEQQKMQECVAAGGTWIYSSCINNGRQM